MTIKTKKNNASVKSFVDAVSLKSRQQDCRTVMKMMREITGKNPKMWGTSIIGYDAYKYTNTTGIENEWPIVGLSPRKNDLTIYIMPGFDEYEDMLAELGKHSIGKSCLYIKKLSDINIEELRKLISESVDHLSQKYSNK